MTLSVLITSAVLLATRSEFCIWFDNQYSIPDPRGDEKWINKHIVNEGTLQININTMIDPGQPESHSQHLNILK